MEQQYKIQLWQSFLNDKTQQRYLMSKYSGMNFYPLTLLLQLVFYVHSIYQVQYLAHSNIQMHSAAPTPLQYASVALMILSAYLYKFKQTKYVYLIRGLAVLLYALNYGTHARHVMKLQCFVVIQSITTSSCLIPNVVEQIILLLVECLIVCYAQPKCSFSTLLFLSVPVMFVSFTLERHRKQTYMIYDYYLKEDKCLQQLNQLLPIPNIVIDSAINVIQINTIASEILSQKQPEKIRNMNQVLRYAITNHTQNSETSAAQLLDITSRSCQSGLVIALQLKKLEVDSVFTRKPETTRELQYSLKFFIKELTIKGKKCYQLTHVNHCQPNEGLHNKQSLLQEMCTTAEHLYLQLAQDYQKRNNLRAFNVLKEKDLENIGRCNADCLMLRQSLQAFYLLMQDHAQVGSSPMVDFHIKNFIVNMFEGFSLKILDKVTSVNLSFEDTFPEVVNGDKSNFLYVLWTILWSLVGDLPQTKYDLSLRAVIHKIQQDKNGYELQFTLQFTCSDQMALMISSALCGAQQQMNQSQVLIGSQVNPHSDHQKFQYFLLSKARQIIKSQGMGLVFESVESELQDGDVVVRRILQFQYIFKFAINKGKDMQTLTKKEVMERAKNIPSLDLSFARQQITPSHFQWKPKVINPVSLMLSINLRMASDRSPKGSSPLLVQPGFQQMQQLQAAAALAKIAAETPPPAPLMKESSIQKIDSFQEIIQEEDDAKSVSSLSLYRKQVNLKEHKKRIKQLLPNLEEIGEDLRAGLNMLIQDVLWQTIQDGEGQFNDLNVNKEEIDEVDETIEQDEVPFSTNFQGRQSSRNHSIMSRYVPDEDQMPNYYDFENSPGLTGSPLAKRQIDRIQEFHTKLFSPQVMSKFSSENLKRIISARKKSGSVLNLFTQNGGSGLVGHSQDGMEILKQKLPSITEVVDRVIHTQMTHRRTWTHYLELPLGGAMERSQQILFMIPASKKWVYYAEKICQYDEKHVSVMVVVQDIHEVLLQYKALLSQSSYYNSIIVSLDHCHTRSIMDIIRVVRAIELKYNLHRTYIAGMVEQTQQIAQILLDELDGTLKTPVDDLQIHKMRLAIDIQNHVQCKH